MRGCTLYQQYMPHTPTDIPYTHISDGMNLLERVLKRGFDLVASALCLIVFLPLGVWCYIMVRREDGGKALFAQERVGRGGKPFMIYKFRSMSPNVEAMGIPMLYDQENDTRLTRIGKFIRQHHLDELPQLWNVLKGDMSFVGPRPERAYFIEQIMEHDPRYSELYQIRPGVTSYATLYNGYTDTMDKMLRRLELDLYYLEHRSLWFDLRVLWLTFYRIVKGDKF